MMSRVRDEGGFGLVELLIAMTVMVIGIFAVVAGFSSGLGAINRASKTTVAGTIADQQMEAFRRGSHAAIVSIAGTTKVGTDGRTYWIESVASSKCPDETSSSPSESRRSSEKDRSGAAATGAGSGSGSSRFRSMSDMSNADSGSASV